MNAGVGDNYEVKVYMYIHVVSNYKYCDDLPTVCKIYKHYKELCVRNHENFWSFASSLFSLAFNGNSHSSLVLRTLPCPCNDNLTYFF